MRLTPDILRGAYDFLRLTRPFKRWNLPPAEGIKFVVGRRTDAAGEHTSYVNGEHAIMISEACVGHLDKTLEVMAHEMIHVYQVMRKTNTRSVHNAEFRRLAAQVCREHGFDPKAFI